MHCCIVMFLYFRFKTKFWSREEWVCSGLKKKLFFFLLQMMQLNALFLVLISVTIPMALRALFGPLPFYVAFVATEAFKVIINLNQIKMINFLSKWSKLSTSDQSHQDDQLLSKPLQEMCWIYMGIAQIALDWHPHLSNSQMWGEKCTKPSWQALTHQGKHGKKYSKSS